MATAETGVAVALCMINHAFERVPSSSKAESVKFRNVTCDIGPTRTQWPPGTSLKNITHYHTEHLDQTKHFQYALSSWEL